MEELEKRISEIVRSTVKEILEPGMAGSMISGFKRQGKWILDSPV